MFFSFVLCQANFMHLWCNSTVCSWEFPPWCQCDTCLEVRRKTGKGLDRTFILDAKLTMVRCFSLFCWAVLSSGRLSLLAAQSHPPQKSRHKIKLGFLHGISTPTPHIKPAIESLSWLCTYSLGKCSISTSHLLWNTMCYQRRQNWISTHKNLSLLRSQAWVHETTWQFSYWSTIFNMSSLSLCYVQCTVLSDSRGRDGACQGYYTPQLQEHQLPPRVVQLDGPGLVLSLTIQCFNSYKCKRTTRRKIQTTRREQEGEEVGERQKGKQREGERKKRVQVSAVTLGNWGGTGDKKKERCTMRWSLKDRQNFSNNNNSNSNGTSQGNVHGKLYLV